MKSYEILQLIKRVCKDPSYDYMEDYNKLNLSNVKRSIVFHIIIKERRFIMNDWLNCFKKPDFYVAVKADKLYEFIEFVRLHKISFIEIFASKTICNRKWFNHTELSSVRFYPYCKRIHPVLRYYCYL